MLPRLTSWSGPELRKTRAALLGWSLLVFVLSVGPAPSGLPEKVAFLSFDTFAHAAFYLPLGALCFFSFPAFSRGMAFLISAGAGLGYGFLIELIQAILPWRHFQLTDAAADLVGSAAGAGAALVASGLGLRALSREHHHKPSPDGNS